METKFQPAAVEEKIYRFWEKKGLLKGKKGKPFTILMPPPNANASLHAGHGMYTIDDIMIRWKMIEGYDALWIPGTDHAGFETQYVYEKYLRKQGKSRTDFDRQTLYKNIFKFVKDNSGLIYKQFNRLGFAADWSRSVFSLDPPVVSFVLDTFIKMYSEQLIYRSDYIVNYCVHCGTSLSELEVEHIERRDPLFYIKYQASNIKITNKKSKGEHIILATTRPETLFGDTAVAVNPKDKRYKDIAGEEVYIPLTNRRVFVIVDDYVDPKFGTGVVKITPAHDPNDFVIGQKHKLKIKQVIDLDGRLTDLAGSYRGLKVRQARQKVVEDLKAKGLIAKIDERYCHSVAICYKCGRDLEPMIIPNWFIKVDGLKKTAIEAVKKNKVKFYPRKYKKQILQWLDVMHDWPISRQTTWGIRIPVWYSVSSNPNTHVVFLDKKNQVKMGKVSDLLKDYRFEEIEAGLQKLSAPKEAVFQISNDKPSGDFLQETDTFDTWFSSGQWPLVTLKKDEYKTRFPTDVLGTLSDILPFWVSRMIMFSLYLRRTVPFRDVYLWSMVTDAKGQKMSKSKGNVINPIDLVDKYGADAFRASLVFGIAQGGQVALSDDKVRAMRNFANKVWNIGRFIYLYQTQNSKLKTQNCNSKLKSNKILKHLYKELTDEQKKHRNYMKRYQFSKAFDMIYRFLWHRLADFYIEELKDEVIAGNIKALESLKEVYFGNLVMLHPFMPFVTEAVWKIFYGEKFSILNIKNKKYIY